MSQIEDEQRPQQTKLTRWAFSSWLIAVSLVMLLLLVGLRPARPVAAAFPGGNGKIAFARDTGDTVYDIFVMNASGGNQVNLTNTPDDDERAPGWSADGSKIVYEKYDGSDTDIWVMNANGSNPTQLTETGDNLDPAWSPDGTKIVFESIRDGDAEIYVMDADGSNETNLTNNAAIDTDPNWSPDGTKIVFSSTRDVSQDEIYVMDADGDNVTRLTTNSAFDGQGNWSPDGTKIAFSRYSLTPTTNLEIYVMNADGSSQTNLTNSTTFEAGPAWSPDGTKIAFMLNDQIWVMDADGGNQINLSDNEEIDILPDWQPIQSVAADGFLVSAVTPGTTGDGVTFDKEDILQWDGSNWSLFFDGSEFGLTAAHNTNAIHVNSSTDLYLSFFQNKVSTTSVGNVQGTDILHFNGTNFELYFDGSDVGLNKVAQEKIDGLHILDGDLSPIGGSCDAYLLISTLGVGKVLAFGGGTLNFSGEDILGFCATNTGANTAGFWTMVLDGSAAGMPKNSTDSISATDDGEVLFLTTKGPFNVDSASGDHSMVYQYSMATGDFSGPFFSAPDNGLDQKVDGLHVVGTLP